jgi:uncharacterized protein (DUF305 family)
LLAQIYIERNSFDYFTMSIMKKLTLLVLSVFLAGCVSSSDSATDFSGNDLMFAAMMVPHHEQAIEMSNLALTRSKNSEILALANEIKNAQDPEIAEMKSWGDLDMGSHMGHTMGGMLTEDEMSELESANGEEFDRLFLEGMIKHHEGAIEMAEMVVDSANTRAATLGKAIIEAQTKEIALMKELLSN